MIRSRYRERSPGGIAASPPVNTVAPVASGTARVGQTLSCTDGTWTGDATISYTYQWRRGGSNIGGATANTYLVTVADMGYAIDCMVTGTNTAGNASQDSNDIAIGTTMASILTSAIFDLDATILASFDGTSQTWANLIGAPADGAAQTDYDFYRGADVTATTDDPAFNGSAGSPSAYFSFDGGDRFSIKSGSNTSFLNNLHKTTGGSDWTCVAAVYTPGISGNGIVNTQSATGDVGLRAFVTSAELLQVTQRGDTANATANSSPTAISVTTPVIVGFGHSHSTNKTKFWVNSGTGIEVSHTYNATTASAVQPATIGWIPNAIPAENGFRLYAISMFNAYLSDGNMASLIAAYNARHGRTYV